MTVQIRRIYRIKFIVKKNIYKYIHMFMKNIQIEETMDRQEEYIESQEECLDIQIVQIDIEKDRNLFSE